MSYTVPTISGYNSTPPADDGTEVASNRVDWSKIKDKLADPIKTWVDAINTNLTTAFGQRYGNSVGTFTGNTTFTSSHEGSIQRFTGSSAATATLPDAATVGSDFLIAFINQGAAALTVQGQSSQTINGALTQDVTEGQSVTYVSDGSNWLVMSANPGLASSFKTGDLRQTVRDVDTGWLNMNGETFGPASSGADNESDTYEALFKLLYQKFAELDAPVLEIDDNWFVVDSFTNGTDKVNETAHGLLDGAKIVFVAGAGATMPTGLLAHQVYYVVNKTTNNFEVSLTEGGSAVNFTTNGSGSISVAELSKTGSSAANADTDWDAGKIMIMPDARSRMLLGSGQGTDSGSQLTSRTMGNLGGEEDHTLTTAETPSHTHTIDTIYNQGQGGDHDIEGLAGRSSGASPDWTNSSQLSSVGSGNAHNNMPPFMVVNTHIKV